MKKIIAIVLAMTLALALCACSGVDKTLCGKYDLYAADYDEETIVLAEGLFEGENYIELKDNGTALVLLDGESMTFNWKSEGDAVTLIAADGAVEGTVTEGLLTIDAEDTNLYFAKEGADTTGLNAVSIEDLFGEMFAGIEEGLTEGVEESDAPSVEEELGEPVAEVSEAPVEEPAA